MRRYVPSYRFWPERPTETVEAIVYLEPQDERNVRAMGYDMSSEPSRRTAMEHARDTAAAAATGRVRLVQELDNDSPQAGFLVYVPVYRGGSIPATVEDRRHLIYGFVYSPFRAGDLLKQILELPEVQGMEVSAYAGGGPPDEANRLYTSAPLEERTLFEMTKPIEVAGERWMLRLRGGVSFIGTARRTATTAVVIVGIVMSLLLFAITMTQAKARAGAERTAEELRRSEEALRAANRSKDEFLAVVSHELRTPLNAIIGWSAMLRRGQVGPEKHTHALQVIERNAHAQARLVEDLLDISRAVAGRLRLEPCDVDVTAMLQATVDALRPTATEQSVDIVMQAPAGLGTITADQSRLQQIVQNLVGNAIKFTPSGGKVTLAASRDGEGIMIRVIDTGIGIRREFLPFAFDRFRQADTSTTRAHGGIGLGLAIVRHLVELHGGTIDVSQRRREPWLDVHRASPRHTRPQPDRALGHCEARPRTLYSPPAGGPNSIAQRCESQEGPMIKGQVAVGTLGLTVCVLVFGASGIAQKGGPKRPGAGIDTQGRQMRPIQLGTSGGNALDTANGFCCSGTLGALVSRHGTLLHPQQHAYLRRRFGARRQRNRVRCWRSG